MRRVVVLVCGIVAEFTNTRARAHTHTNPAQVCILDDITRAPGEALNVLLRILEERMHGSNQIPLVSAIATANPAGDAYYTDPIDPATLDRFDVPFIQPRAFACCTRTIRPP